MDNGTHLIQRRHTTSVHTQAEHQRITRFRSPFHHSAARHTQHNRFSARCIHQTRRTSTGHTQRIRAAHTASSIRSIIRRIREIIRKGRRCIQAEIRFIHQQRIRSHSAVAHRDARAIILKPKHPTPHIHRSNRLISIRIGHDRLQNKKIRLKSVQESSIIRITWIGMPNRSLLLQSGNARLRINSKREKDRVANLAADSTVSLLTQPDCLTLSAIATQCIQTRLQCRITLNNLQHQLIHSRTRTIGTKVELRPADGSIRVKERTEIRGHGVKTSGILRSRAFRTNGFAHLTSAFIHQQLHCQLRIHRQGRHPIHDQDHAVVAGCGTGAVRHRGGEGDQGCGFGDVARLGAGDMGGCALQLEAEGDHPGSGVKALEDQRAFGGVVAIAGLHRDAVEVKRWIDRLQFSQAVAAPSDLHAGDVVDAIGIGNGDHALGGGNGFVALQQAKLSHHAVGHEQRQIGIGIAECCLELGIEILIAPFRCRYGVGSHADGGRPIHWRRRLQPRRHLRLRRGFWRRCGCGFRCGLRRWFRRRLGSRCRRRGLWSWLRRRLRRHSRGGEQVNTLGVGEIR